MMKNQSTQTTQTTQSTRMVMVMSGEGESSSSGSGGEMTIIGKQQQTSKDTQTDLFGIEVEKLREFADKYFDKQLKLDSDLR